jgi:hypothetical protein
VAAGAGAHLGGQLIHRHGVRGPVAAALAPAVGGLYLLSRVGEHGNYLHDVLPGMLIVGFGLGFARRACCRAAEGGPTVSPVSGSALAG